MDEDGPGRGHPCRIDTFIVFVFTFSPLQMYGDANLTLLYKGQRSACDLHLEKKNKKKKNLVDLGSPVLNTVCRHLHIHKIHKKEIIY